MPGLNTTPTTTLTPAAIWQRPNNTNSDRYAVSCLAMSPDGKWLASSGLYYHGLVHVWETATGKCRLTWQGGEGLRVGGLVWMQQHERNAAVWDNNSPTTSLLLLLAVRTMDGFVRLWTRVDAAAAAAALADREDYGRGTSRPECVHTLRVAGSHGGEWVRVLAVVTTRFLLAGTHQGTLAVWDAQQEFDCVQQWRASSHQDIRAVQGLLLRQESTDCLVVIAATPSDIECWKLQLVNRPRITTMTPPQRRVATFLVGRKHGNNPTVTCLAASPDGTLLASGTSQGTLPIWSISSLQEQDEHDGRNKVGSSSFDEEHSSCLAVLQGSHTNEEVSAVNWLPPHHPHANDYLVVGGKDGRVSLWHVPTHTCCAQFVATSSSSSRPIKAMVLQPNASRIVGALSHKLSLHVWHLPLVQLYPPIIWYRILQQEGLFGVWQHLRTTDSLTKRTSTTTATTGS